MGFDSADRFHEVLADEQASAELLDAALPVRRFEVPAELIDPDGRVRVRELLAAGTGFRRSRKPLLVLTGRNLRVPGLAAAFGYSDPALAAAVISTARLQNAGVAGAGAGDSLARERLCKVMAHELGHLAGIGHCASLACTMSAARTLAELDARPATRCGACPALPRRRYRIAGAIAAIALVAVLVAGLDRVASFAAGKPFDAPFT